LFDTPDSANSAGSRLNTIFGRLPSLTNPDFLGMDAALNKLKGSFWNPGLQGSKLNSANGHAAVQCLSNLAVVMDIANNAKVASLFSATNGRIHSAFKGVDALITAQEGCGNALKDSNDKPIEATWAASYKAYITNKIAGQNDLITKTAAVLSAAIPTNVDAAKPNQKGNVKDWSAFVSNFNGKYQIKSLTFPEPQDWPDNTLNIQKRHGPACTRKSEANPSGTAGTAGTGTAGKGTETGTGTGKAGGSGSTATSASGSGTVSAGGKPSTITTAPTATSGTGATFSSATPKATSSLFCYPFQDPAAGPAPPRCECGGLDGFYPYLSSTSGATKFNPCGYKTLPTTASASAVPAFTTTEANGKVVSCASSTYYNYAVNTDATCAGSTQVISTVASIASAYSAAAASSVSVASVASASASWASAAAVPSAGCWILSDDGFGDSAFEVYGINGWAGSDGSNLFDQENGCGILSGPEFHTDGQDEFDGRLRNTQYAYFGLSFFKGGCIERAVHSAGGPPPGDGPGQLACQHGPSLSNTQLNAANKILGAQLKAVKAVADGSSATSSLSTNKKVNLAGGSSASSSKPAGGSQPDPSVVESASAALPHLLAAQSGVSAAPASTSA